MDCVVKLNISYVLKKVIEKLVYDFNYWMDLGSSEELNLLSVLESSLKDRALCERQCLGCLDYHLVNNIFHEFIQSIEAINKENSGLLNVLINSFSLEDSANAVSVAVELISNPEYVGKKLDENNYRNFEEYVRKILQAHSILAIGYINQRKIELHDIILPNHSLQQEQSFNYKELNVRDCNKIFYLDQNFVSRCVNNENLMIQIILT